jgi:hypothetical protein
MKPFDEFPEKKLLELRRKARSLMTICEWLPKQIHHDLKQLSWTKAAELAEVAEQDGRGSVVQPGCTGQRNCRRTSSKELWSDIHETRNGTIERALEIVTLMHDRRS